MNPLALQRRRAIAEELLGAVVDAHGYARCPGSASHTSRNGARDFRLWVAGVPSAKCVHDSCVNVVADFLHEWRSRVAKAELQSASAPRPPSLAGAVAPMPVPPRKPKRPPYDPAALMRVADLVPVRFSADFIAERSPVPVPVEQGIEMARLFLDTIYAAGERVLIFTDQVSAGDFMHEAGLGSFRLSRERGVDPVPSRLPAGAPEGVWFLTNPVDGAWHKKADGSGWSRRTGDCVTAWRFILLESDAAPADLWLRCLCALPLRIVAIYTSGSRSVHALATLAASGKVEWDSMRDVLVDRLCPLGADGAAMSAVRLSRLPGCLRGGKRDREGKLIRYAKPALQRLIYLNPNPTGEPLVDFLK